MEVRELLYDEPGEPREETLVVNFFMDCRDAMGANMINTTAEHLAPEIEALTGAKVRTSRTKAEALAFSVKYLRQAVGRRRVIALVPSCDLGTRGACALPMKRRTAEPAMTLRVCVLTKARYLQVGIKILSNLADRRLVSGDVSIPVERLATASLDGMQVAQAIAAAYRFAYADPYRACTHNKVRRGQANRFFCICRQRVEGSAESKGRVFGLHVALD